MALLWFTQTLVTYTCVVSPANPDASGRGWARLPSSLSLALHPSGVCRYHLDIFIKKKEACTHMQIHTHTCMDIHAQVWEHKWTQNTEKCTLRKFTHTHKITHIVYSHSDWKEKGEKTYKHGNRQTEKKKVPFISHVINISSQLKWNTSNQLCELHSVSPSASR